MEQMEIGANDAEDNNVSLLQGYRTLRQQLLQEGRRLEDEPSAQREHSQEGSLQEAVPGQAGSAGPPAKQRRKESWENKLAFRYFIKGLAEAMTDDEEEEALATKEKTELMPIRKAKLKPK